jgi:hypothetical protein
MSKARKDGKDFTKLSNEFNAIKARVAGPDTRSKGLQRKSVPGEKEQPSRETTPFANIMLADEYCKYSTGDIDPKRFKVVQTRRSYACASKECGVQRHLDRKTLVVTEWGIHDDEAHAASESKPSRHFLSYSERAKLFEAFDEGEERLQECGMRLGLTGRKVAKWKHHLTGHEQQLTDLELHEKVIGIAHSLDASIVVDSCFYENGYVIMATTQRFLNTKFAPNDVVCLDGNVDFIKKKTKKNETKKNRTIVTLGVVKNGDVDPSHSYAFMSLGIFSSEENKQDSRKFIDLVSSNRDDDALDTHSKFMLDGSGGFRAALEQRVPFEILMAMCWFHVTKGVQLRINLLPQKKWTFGKLCMICV